ncbi:Metacaspase-1 [Colletotrichum sp. SAR 10_70]|nr:Metacaspase-1 [Colletotrichum sp. SAR 10_71]KAI8198751.1 Metacaspase-1 [Colletotrichum sp. SAR 10_70]
METVGAKRALLIGSPVHGLKGTDNDLKAMAKLLKSHGFDVGNDVYVKTLFQETATRQNILAAWNALILNASREDTVVIYYSGHGKLTDDHLETNRYAVRIAAAATDETAWEYHEDGHNYMGLLTKNLDRALTNSSRQRSWRDVMLELAVKYLNNDVALEDAMERLLDHAKEYGQARSILSLRSGVDEELLGEEVDIVLGVESSGKKTILTRRSDS